MDAAREKADMAKTIENRWFSIVFAMSAWSLAMSILDDQGIQKETK